MPSPRRIRELTPAELQELDRQYRITNNADLRTRCQIILLSHQGYSTAQIANLVRFSEDTVLYWTNRYEAKGLAVARGLRRRLASGERLAVARTGGPTPTRSTAQKLTTSMTKC